MATSARHRSKGGTRGRAREEHIMVAMDTVVSETEGEDDEDDEGEVQALLTAIQQRKEKQQKNKRALRERANKSLHALKLDADAQAQAAKLAGEQVTDVGARMTRLLERMDQTWTGIPASTVDAIRHEQRSLVLARSQLRKTIDDAVDATRAEESRLLKRIARIRENAQANSKRSRNDALVRSLEELGEEVRRVAKMVRV